MKHPSCQTDQELQWNATDALEAISCHPAGENVDRYLMEMRSCQREFRRRDRVRIWRRSIRETFDPLEFLSPRERRWQAPNSTFAKYRSDLARSAMFHLGWMKLHGN